MLNKKIPGNTKLVRLINIEKEFDLDCELYGKVENSNPSGSIKDRAVYQMLLDYIEEGKLTKDTVIVEATSGNTGIALAYFSKIFNYRLIIYMPSSMSKERREMISSLGAELKLVDGGMAQAEELALSDAKNNDNYLLFDQFNNKSNVKAHLLTTGPEIVKDLMDVNYVFAGIGTGGTATGIAQYFKNNNIYAKVIGVEPSESPLLTKGYAGKHLIQGIGANFIPSILDASLLTDIVDVEGEKAIEMAKLIRSIENIDIGISSGAALLGAISYIKNNSINNKKIVIIFPDKGNRYSW